MNTAIADFIIQQGSTFGFTAICKDGDGAVVDLTGYEARMQLRDSVDDTTTLLSLTSSPAAGITITAGTGTIQVSITPTQTAALDFKTSPYDLELYSSSDADVLRIIKGTMTLSKEVTR